jgi:hypothetical protein
MTSERGRPARTCTRGANFPRKFVGAYVSVAASACALASDAVRAAARDAAAA